MSNHVQEEAMYATSGNTSSQANDLHDSSFCMVMQELHISQGQVSCTESPPGISLQSSSPGTPTQCPAAACEVYDCAPSHNHYTPALYPPNLSAAPADPTGHAMATYPSQGHHASSAAPCAYPSYLQHPSYELHTYGGVLRSGIKAEGDLGPSETPTHSGYLGSGGYCGGYPAPQPAQSLYPYSVQGGSYSPLHSSSLYTGGLGCSSGAAGYGAAPQQEVSGYAGFAPQTQYQSYYPSVGYNPAYASAGTSSSSSASGGTPYHAQEHTGAVPAMGELGTPPPQQLVVVSPRGGSNEDERMRRGGSGRSRVRGRKQNPSPMPDSNLERVFIWDLDETIIVFHSLLTGSFAARHGKDHAASMALGLRMEELIFNLADTHLFFNDLEECDQSHIDDVSADDNGQDLGTYNFATDGFCTASGSGGGLCVATGVRGGSEWMRKLAFRYRHIKEIYNTYKNNLPGLLGPVKGESWLQLLPEIENLTESWLMLAHKCLSLIHSRSSSENVLVTTTQLIPALSKVLLYGFGEVFPINNIFSATKMGKESCFERIVSHYGRKVIYVVIGDGVEEEQVAKKVGTHNVQSAVRPIQALHWHRGNVTACASRVKQR
ncbi:eyes absent homolog 1-like isoform X2 [Lethenteron reissneri]|uniref:eyes absent homolog 1-like isoform X2 n=1 Tax=Lethenteron reissneri TaxID=7753 RepID=UPI002AB7652B|nr:eyes absent homolog 1-like isoform X2 [Lethenteron reissneri]